MIIGLGIDLVSIERVRKYLNNDCLKNGFIHYTFTNKEIEAANQKKDPAEYLATRFAVKEAFFKAASHIGNDINIDIRKTECLNHENGSPYITEQSISYITEQYHISAIHVSISTEDDYALAEVIIEG